MKNDSFTELLKLENFISANEQLYLKLTNKLKCIYDQGFSHVDPSQAIKSNYVSKLLIEGFTYEQIYQQLVLVSKKRFISSPLADCDCKFILRESSDIQNDSVEQDEDLESDCFDGNIEDVSDENLRMNEDDVSVNNDAISDDGESSDKNDEKLVFQPKNYQSCVDDKFFKLCDMENFLTSNEKGDYFENVTVDLNVDTDEREDDDVLEVKYNDFFTEKPLESNQLKKSVTWKDEMPVKNDAPMSNFEKNQEAMKRRIEEVEKEMLAPKPWKFLGETEASERPENSLLEEYLEFDRQTAVPPPITEEFTNRIEEIVKQRIKDRCFDDVERKVKPLMENSSKNVNLNFEKNELSLAEIYEKEYLKSKNGEQEAVNPVHQEISEKMESLFYKLDALFHSRFTPQMPSAHIEIVSNVPAIVMEEVAPIATADDQLLAPEEIFPTPKEIKSKSELTASDKNRIRKAKKNKIKQKNIRKKRIEQALASKAEVSTTKLDEKRLLKKVENLIKKTPNMRVAKRQTKTV